MHSRERVIKHAYVCDQACVCVVKRARVCVCVCVVCVCVVKHVCAKEGDTPQRQNVRVTSHGYQVGDFW
jgi:hypothetical protein